MNFLQQPTELLFSSLLASPSLFLFVRCILPRRRTWSVASKGDLYSSCFSFDGSIQVFFFTIVDAPTRIHSLVCLRFPLLGLLNTFRASLSVCSVGSFLNLLCDKLFFFNHKSRGVGPPLSDHLSFWRPACESTFHPRGYL